MQWYLRYFHSEDARFLMSDVVIWELKPCISDLRDVVDGIDFETPCGDLCAIKRHTELIILVEKKETFRY